MIRPNPTLSLKSKSKQSAPPPVGPGRQSVPVPRPTSVLLTGQAVKSAHKTACSSFNPQKWRANVCSECFFFKEHHANVQTPLEQALASIPASDADPTEVFELIDIIGAGAYGSVFLGRTIGNEELYAIKFMEIGGQGEDKTNEVISIVNEINIMKQSTNCPFVVEYHGCYMKDEVIMMVMEYCACSVEDILSFCPDVQFEEKEIAAVCAAIIKGLSFLHTYGITHRDIKSGNVLLKETGEIRLADFGVSHKITEQQEKMKTLAGSPYWCAPELISADSYNNKVDLWACGIVALEMAESRPPHWDMQPLEVILHIPKSPAPRLKDTKKWSPDFQDFLSKCLQKNPDDRSAAKELLYHPFILQGSSTQILSPLVKKCLPILMPRKKEELKEAQDDDNENYKGTMVSVNRDTYRADIVTPSDPAVARAKNRLSVAPTLIQS
eukprot:TRINITY_DN3664_c0_g1_i1.p1 TRINITY_DN3664_c0_g1~~TRINITY_DN3664_c0_g1_i1.p1  ORF type:complete len:439 (-),score=110.89 TRINITY_DN3664_c0_g1_i1:52-1368(-)